MPDQVRRTMPIFLVSAIMVCCLFLQRFGIPFGEQMVPLAGPIGLAFAAAGLLQEKLSFNKPRLILFFVLLLLVAAGDVYNAGRPAPFGASISTPSVLQFLGLTFFTTFEFAEPMDESRFFQIVNKFFLYIAFAGSAQFFAQFVGVKIFTLAQFLPGSIMAEKGWNLQIPFGIGDLYKANGFFLVEPSVLSQFMAVAIIIEILYFKRTLYLCMFLLCFVLAFSGTGGLVLFGFVLASAARLGMRGIVTAILLLTLFAGVAAAVMFIAPDIGGMAQGRMSEFYTPGTSGHMRFVTPFWMMADVLHRYPMAAIFGTGGGTSEHLPLPYDYDTNTPVKIGTEFGLFTLFVYVLLFAVGRRTPRQSVLVLPMLILLLITGSYQQFPPVLFLVALLICMAWLKVTGPLGPKQDRATALAA